MFRSSSPRVITVARLIAALIAAPLATMALRAQPRPADPLALVVSADPLDLARMVDRLGDDAVRARLGEVGAAANTLDPAIVMAAVRASAWLHAPEEALVRLVEIAAGRDPELAPAAMLAVIRIAERLERSELDAREASDAPVREALAPLAALTEDSAARADLRRAAARAHTLLRALLEADAP